MSGTILAKDDSSSVKERQPEFTKSPLCEAIDRPLDLKTCSRGWESQKEYSYWVPEADVEGEIPLDFCGTLFRNGPGVSEVYGKRLNHPIDGDGMVCALTFKDGRVHFRSKFVSTKHRREESEKQNFIYMGQMGTRATGVLAETANTVWNLLQGKFPKIKFRNPSNTNSFYWGGKVITSYETSVPHCLDPHTLETLGPENLNGHLSLGSFAAHYRIDPDNQRLVCISLRPGFNQKESLVIYEFDSRWHLFQKKLLHIPGLNYAHDFLLLPDYYVFHMTPFIRVSSLVALKMFCGLAAPADDMRYHAHLPSRFVFIPRYGGGGEAEQGVIFVDTDPCHIFHFATGEQQGSTVQFSAVCLDTNMDMTFDSEVWLSNTSVAPGRMFNYTIDLNSQTCSRVQADSASVEFPSTHPYRHGQRGTRYSYLMANARPSQNLPYRDVVKFDSRGEERQVWYSRGCIGEPVFIPRLGYRSCRAGDEDDGYVIVQLYVPEKHVTEFCLLDAKDLGSGPLARVKLKHHVPYGFHGTFTPEVFTLVPVVMSKL